MKAFEVRDGFGLDALVPAERPVPITGPGQVLVRIRAVSLNYRDLLVVKGLYNPRLSLPCIPCSDGAGEVLEVGPGVTRVKPGDRVAGIFMQGWLEGRLTDAKAQTALGGGIDGVLAEYVLFHEDGVVLIPEQLSFEEGATLPCAALTAWHAVIEDGIKPGETVLTIGTGGVSLFAIQFARLAGAEVLAISRTREKLARAIELGAMAGIDSTAFPEWDKEARRLTGKSGVDLVVEVGGAGTLPRSLRAVKSGGRISLIGVLSGATGEVNPLPAVMKGVRLQGILVGSREMFERMNKAVAAHQLHPVIDQVFPFQDAVEAFRYLETGAQFGKIVITL